MTSSPTPKRIMLQTPHPPHLPNSVRSCWPPHMIRLIFYSLGFIIAVIMSALSSLVLLESGLYPLCCSLTSSRLLVCFVLGGIKDRTLPIIARFLVHPVTSPPSSPRPRVFSPTVYQLVELNSECLCLARSPRSPAH